MTKKVSLTVLLFLTIFSLIQIVAASSAGVCEGYPGASKFVGTVTRKTVAIPGGIWFEIDIDYYSCGEKAYKEAVAHAYSSGHPDYIPCPGTVDLSLEVGDKAEVFGEFLNSTNKVDLCLSKDYYITQPQALPAPTLQSIDNTDLDGSFTVSWSAVSGASGYILNERFNNGTWVSIYEGAATSVKRNYLADGEYCYRVRAVSTTQVSSVWSEIKCTTVDAVPDIPGAPTLLDITNEDQDGNYTVNWFGVAGAESYELQERFNDGAWNAVYNSFGTSKERINRADGEWCYRVRAANIGGISGWSKLVCTTVDTIPEDGELYGLIYEPYPSIGRKPCSGVLVSAGDGMSTESDENGDYSLKLPAGTYNVSFKKSGYTSIELSDIQILEKQRTNFDIRMMKEDCWSSGQVCYAEFYDVVPIIGWTGYEADFWNTWCEVDKRIEQGDWFSAIILGLLQIVDMADFPIIGDKYDALEAYILCFEATAYEHYDSQALYKGKGIGDLAKGLWQKISNSLIVIVDKFESSGTDTATYDAVSSDVELHIHSDKQHLGLTDGKIEHSIPGSYLFRLGNRYQIAIIKNATNDYRVQIEGKGDAEYNLFIANSSEDENGTYGEIKGLAALSGSVAEIDVKPSVIDFALRLDYDGDGETDEIVHADHIETLVPVSQSGKVFLPVSVGNGR